jgi:aspartate carbamoyltransferase catalytic subunit
MSPDILIVRHPASGAAHFLAKHLANTSVVNAGDGAHEHPTQALLDCLSLFRHFGEQKLEQLKISIVGDIRHSRVARSNLLAHKLLGNEVTLVAPPTLAPNEFIDQRAYGSGVKIEHNLIKGIKGADVVMCLRIQLEREAGNFIPSLEEYSKNYCVAEKLLAEHAPNSVVLHPGPINRGIEITSEVADGPRSLVRDQVSCGVAVRMAVLLALSAGNREIAE